MELLGRGYVHNLLPGSSWEEIMGPLSYLKPCFRWDWNPGWQSIQTEFLNPNQSATEDDLCG